MSEAPQILRPTPRRPFELPSADSSSPSTPSGETQGQGQGQTQTQTIESIDFLDAKNDLAAKRSGSLLNLTSSTLLGIFQPTAFEDSREEDSPWDTQAHTPIETRNDPLASLQYHQQQQRQRQQQYQHHRQNSLDGPSRKQIHRTGSAYYIPLVLKVTLLFVCGVVYGTIIAHLHENNWIIPVKFEYIDRNSYKYLFSWGIAGVAFAFVLPWLDNNLGDNGVAGLSEAVGGEKESRNSWVSRWTLAVRSIGAFVGIGFAMRKLPWESTTQESLTLALVNPFLWYIIDRTKTGFWLSTVVALTGMGLTLGLHPELIPSAASASASVGLGLRNWRLEYNVEGGLSQDATAVAVWLASVFFSACVCFGNIGRQLALNDSSIQHVHLSSEKR